jgi:predicted alpha/beta superfamily hydrolase
MKIAHCSNASFALLVLVMLFISACLPERQNEKTIIEDKSHFSSVFNEDRNFRVFLPPDYYDVSDKVYPIIYFFHGYGGRFNGPAEGVQSRSAEARYYDEFSGNWERCGPDSLDNIAEFVRTHDVIVAKWDGFVKEQYPRPYDIGPVKQDIQFVPYFKEFSEYIDANYRTLGTREGRAVSGLSMGGFMSMNVSGKFPSLFSSASFFCPSAAFTIGPKELQIHTQFKHMRFNYVGLSIRMHIGQNDFLRQYHLEMEKEFKAIDLDYEGWHYGTKYFNGFHNVVNVEGQFDFHMKNFRNPPSKPEKWHHVDLFPEFKVWNYAVHSNRAIPGFTIMQDVRKEGFKISMRKWLPNGPFVDNPLLEIETDSIYVPNEILQVVSSTSPYVEVKKEEIKADDSAKLKLKLSGLGTDIGIFRSGDQGYLSVPDIRLNLDMPVSNETFQIKPVIFNKGGSNVENVQIAVISKNADLEILTEPQTISAISSLEIHDRTAFIVRAVNEALESAMIQIQLNYEGKSEVFWMEIPFFNSQSELKSFEVADGRKFSQEYSADKSSFGTGNGNGIADPGESISILTQPSGLNPNWYGLKLYTNDPFVDDAKEEQQYNNRNDWSGAMRITSESYIKPGCPKGHVIKFYGEYDYPKKGNIPRDKQAAHSFIHGKKRVSVEIRVGG